MSIVLDLIVVAIILLFVFITMKKGFVKNILNIAALVITLLVIINFANPISVGIYNAFIEKPVCSSIEKTIVSAEEKGESMVAEFWNDMPNILTNTAENSGINSSELSDLILGSNDAAATAQQISDDIIKPTVVSILVIAVDIILFVVLMFVFKIIIKAICKLFKAPVLNQVNKLFGGILGFVKGVIIAILVCSVISFIVYTSKNGEFLFFTKEVIDKTYLFSKFANILQLNSLL